ncbi:DUF4124 domain-containing protein [Pseudomonas turukhanskensis]|uniref:DUF4124 domain-containing protein n=1 Tax=Pseudomonas turukhanskensis TaxID=1806536 RepID=A0A9W6NI84_9PSED|nr:DUF4124 domain-containing protein [Pseudomonas turukhanskensis]GLK91888.1 hypothetical protein GCM10017655_49520 [Pseudomonas turukhanskensis]
MRRMIITGSLLLALSATASASQVYKWVDAQGNTHFGNQPPQGQDATQVNTGVAQPKPATPAPAPLPLPGTAADDPAQKAIDEKVKQEVAQKEVERAKYCEAVRTHLAQLQNNPRLMIEVDGEKRRFTEDERQAKIAEDQKSIADTCAD